MVLLYFIYCSQGKEFILEDLEKAKQKLKKGEEEYEEVCQELAYIHEHFVPQIEQKREIGNLEEDISKKEIIFNDLSENVISPIYIYI